MANMITFEQTISGTPERVFDAFVTPADLLHWHRASEDWTTPHAETDPRVGGRFNIGFGDPTGEHSFDFTGEYTEVDRPNRLAFTIDDGRRSIIEFADAGNGKTLVTWSFEPENVFPAEMQRDGWAAQLANLEKYLAT